MFTRILLVWLMYGIAGWRNTPGMPYLKSMDEMYPELKARNKQSTKMKGVAGSRPNGHIGGREINKYAMLKTDRAQTVNYMNRGG